MKTGILIFLIFTALNCPYIYSQTILLNVSGKDSVETSVIKKIGYTRNFSDFSRLEKEIDSILIKAKRKGFIDAQIKEVIRINDSLVHSVILLDKLFEEIKVIHKTSEEEKQVIKNLSTKITNEYFIVPIYNIDKVFENLLSQKAEKGDVFSSYTLKNIKKHGTSISAELDIHTTKPRTIDRIVIKEYEKFPSSFLSHFLGIKKNKVYSNEKLLSQTRKMDNLLFVSQIKPPEILFTADSTVVYLYLQKENSNIFEGFLGFSNSEKNKMIFTGDLSLQLYNNLNYGEKLNIRYKSDGNDQINFSTSLDLPYIAKTPLGLNLGLNIFKKDSTFINIEQKVKFQFTFNNTFSSYLGFKSTNSTNSTSENYTDLNLENFESVFYSIGGTYELFDKNNLLVPIQTFITIDLATGTRETEKKIPQQKVELNTLHNFYINDRNSIFIQNKSGLLISENYLENELFFFGGINSVRGYTENSIQANKFSSFQAEYRYFLTPNLYVNSITDFTLFENSIFSQQEKLLGLGFGFALGTQSGILRVNIANGRTQKESFQFSKSKIHISLSVHF